MHKLKNILENFLLITIGLLTFIGSFAYKQFVIIFVVSPLNIMKTINMSYSITLQYVLNIKWRAIMPIYVCVHIRPWTVM
jgi:hypothetical protein